VHPNNCACAVSLAVSVQGHLAYKAVKFRLYAQLIWGNLLNVLTTLKMARVDFSVKLVATYCTWCRSWRPYAQYELRWQIKTSQDWMSM